MSESFASLLHQHRLAAALTQERLAERAGISATGIASLERGRRRAPRLSTVRLIADALELDGEALAEFSEAASRPPEPAGEVAPRRAAPQDRMPGRVRSMGTPPRRRRLVGREDEIRRAREAWASSERPDLIRGGERIRTTRF